MSNLIAVIAKKAGSKRKSDLGAGQDTVLTIFDMSQTYTKMIEDAVELAPLLAEELAGQYSEEVLSEGLSAQLEAWSKTLNDENDGSVAWATTSMRDGVRTLTHNKSGKEYIQGVVVASKIIKFDTNRPLPTKRRGHKSELTAVKAEFRDLANQWRMVGLEDHSIVVTGQEAQDLFESIR